MYAEHHPSEPLRAFVECYWTIATGPSAALAPPVRVLPDGCMDIIFDLSDASATVIGTMTRAVLAEPGPGTDLLAVRFRPGAAPAFLGAPAREATDDSIALDALWGAFSSELAERLSDARSTPRRIALLERELLGRLARFEKLDAVALYAVSLVVSARGEVRIDDLAARIGRGTRQLERVFHELVGVSPKVFARIARFRALTDALRGEPEPRWAELAARFGFYDQAHLVREFKAFADLTPGAYVRERMSYSSNTGEVVGRIVRPRRKRDLDDDGGDDYGHGDDHEHDPDHEGDPDPDR